MNSKNHKRGEQHPRANLTEREVELIRQLAEQGMPNWILAKKFGISPAHCSRIVRYLRRPRPP